MQVINKKKFNGNQRGQKIKKLFVIKKPYMKKKLVKFLPESETKSELSH